jgi:hypothetical protein
VGVPASEVREFAAMVTKLLDLKTRRQISADTVARRMLAEDDRENLAAIRKAHAPPKRGRPAEPRKHLRIMFCIEAYRATGLGRDKAVERTADKWGLSFDQVQDVYKREKFPLRKSQVIREFFKGHRPSEIDEAIDHFLGRGP